MTDQERADYIETVKHPGKFEGCSPIAPYFYDRMMEGDGEIIGSDDCGGDSYTALDVDDTDRAEWPDDLAGVCGVIVHETSQGFVYVETYETQEAYAAACERVQESYAVDEDE